MTFPLELHPLPLAESVVNVALVLFDMKVNSCCKQQEEMGIQTTCTG